jgi:hypothetical protein
MSTRVVVTSKSAVESGADGLKSGGSQSGSLDTSKQDDKFEVMRPEWGCAMEGRPVETFGAGVCRAQPPFSPAIFFTETFHYNPG